MCTSLEDSYWQTDVCSVMKRIEYAYTKSMFCDVKFLLVEPNDTKVIIPATKYILAVTSPVFAAMFHGEFAESTNKAPIELPDCTVEGFKEFLRYIHTDEIHLTAGNVVDVMYIAEKYIVTPLITLCQEYINYQLQPEDVFAVFPKLTLSWDNTLLRRRCWDLIIEQTPRALSSSSFLDISHDLLCQVLLRNKLAIKEVSLFQAVDRWVSKRIQEMGLEMDGKVKRRILGQRAIGCIRFPLMSERDFAESVLPSRVLKMHEVTELVQIFNSLRPVSRCFCSHERNGESHLLIPPDRFETIDPIAFNGTLTSSVDFEINRTIQVVGVRLFGRECSSFEVDLSISELGKHDSKCHFISTFEAGDKIDNLYYAVDVILKPPIEVSPGNQYAIKFKMKGLHQCIGSHGKHEVTFQDIKVTYKNPKLEFNQHFRGAKPEGGQIQALILQRIQEDV